MRALKKAKGTADLDLKVHYIGTCQACFNLQVARSTGGSPHCIVLHGYLRPGFGYIKGSCAGVDQQPYELSCEATKYWKLNCEKSLASREARHADLTANRVDELLIQVRDYDRPSTYEVPSPTKLHTLKRGEIYQDPKRAYKRVSFEDARQKAIAETASAIEELKETIADLAVRIREWKYAPELLKDHETVKREARVAKDEEKLAAGFRRNWKDTWKRIAEVIDSHKRQAKNLDELREVVGQTDAKWRADYDEMIRRFGHATGDRSFEQWMTETKAHYQGLVARDEKSYAEKWCKPGIAPWPTDEERKAARDRAKPVKKAAKKGGK